MNASQRPQMSHKSRGQTEQQVTGRAIADLAHLAHTCERIVVVWLAELFKVRLAGQLNTSTH
jgi:hypothetical protein